MGAVRTLRERARRPVTSSLIASAVILGLGVITGALLARALGPTGRGELAAVIVWPILLLRVGSLGANEGIVFHAARARSAWAPLASTSLALALVQSVPLVLIGLVLIPLVLSQHESSVITDGLIYLAVIPVGLLNLYLSSLLNGAHHYPMFNLLRALIVAASAAGIVVLAVADELTVTSAVIAYLAGQAVTLVVSVFAVAGLAGFGEPVSRPLARQVLAFGWRSQLSTISSTLNERLDQLVISVVLAASSLGLYVVAWTISSVITWVGWSISFVALPAVASGDSRMERLRAARRYVRMTLLGSALLGAALFIAAPPITELVFGDAFTDSVELTRILVVATVFLATARVLEAVLKGANEPLDASRAEAVALMITAIGLAVLLPTIGIAGAAITSLAAYAACAAVALRRANAALGARGLELIR